MDLIPPLSSEEVTAAEDAKLEMRGILHLAAGYIQWQAASDCEPHKEEVSDVAFALERFAKRHSKFIENLIYRK